jgi:EAL domain-containing protein (putative c-di-GMP-specific phosphodiesterase class I)
VDFVKIDGSFVRNMQTDVLQYTMVRSMNDIAHALGKRTVAEYVETEDCLRKLQEIGVDYVQGYFTGEPRIVSLDKATRESAPTLQLVKS